MDLGLTRSQRVWGGKGTQERTVLTDCFVFSYSEQSNKFAFLSGQVKGDLVGCFELTALSIAGFEDHGSNYPDTSPARGRS